jgi:hypothetical protein
MKVVVVIVLLLVVVVVVVIVRLMVAVTVIIIITEVVLPIIIAAIRSLSQNLSRSTYVDKIPGMHFRAELRKTAIMGTHLEEVLMLQFDFPSSLFQSY